MFQHFSVSWYTAPHECAGSCGEYRKLSDGNTSTANRVDVASTWNANDFVLFVPQTGGIASSAAQAFMHRNGDQCLYTPSPRPSQHFRWNSYGGNFFSTAEEYEGNRRCGCSQTIRKETAADGQPKRLRCEVINLLPCGCFVQLLLLPLNAFVSPVMCCFAQKRFEMKFPLLPLCFT